MTRNIIHLRRFLTLNLLLGILCLAIMIPAHGQQVQSTGLVISHEAAGRVPEKVKLIRENYSQLPETYSLKQFCPRPGNQIQLNTSPSWAVSYSAFTILEAEKSGITDQQNITRNTFSPVYNYLLSTGFKNNNCSVATSLTGVLESLKRYGVPKYTEFEGFCPDSIPADLYSLAAENKIDSYSVLFSDNDAPEFRLQAVKKSLSQGNPVIVGMYCPPSFFTAKEFWQPREKAGNNYNAQAMCIIGYDNARYNGSFEILNSRGSSWGNEGFMWIRYTDFLDYTFSAYELFKSGQYNRQKILSELINLNAEGNIPVEASLLKPGFYQTRETLRTGSKFRILLTNKAPAYVYALSIDRTGNIIPIFPPDNNTSPLLNYKNCTLALPGENYFFEINNTPGDNNIIFLFSTNDINFKNLINSLSKISGDISARLNSLSQYSIISNDNVSWDNNEISFSATGNGEFILPVYIDIRH